MLLYIHVYITAFLVSFSGSTYSLVHSMYTKYRQDIQQQIALQPLQRVVVAVQSLTADALADADVQVFM